MKQMLTIFVAISAAAAAFFWYLSASGEIPPMLSYYDAIPPDDPFFLSIRYAARMNRWAAGCAGASAAGSAILVFLN
jgi:hypothetical protein